MILVNNVARAAHGQGWVSLWAQCLRGAWSYNGGVLRLPQESRQNIPFLALSDLFRPGQVKLSGEIIGSLWKTPEQGWEGA